MNDQLLRTFIVLVNFDQKIRSLHDEREVLTKQRLAIDDQRTLLSDSLEHSKQQVRDFKRDVDEKELVMKVLDQQETEKKRRLEVVASPKEYTSLKTEVNTINEQQNMHEPALIDAWDRLDAMQKKYAAEQDSYNKKIIDLEIHARALDQKIQALTQAIDDHEKQRVTFVREVPSELVDNYEHMRALVLDPVVPVEHNSCSACFYPTPAQDLAILKKGKLLPCKSCYRILFIEDIAQE